MGEDSEIRYVHYRHREGMKEIHVLVSITSDVPVTSCWLESPTDRVHLRRPTDHSELYSVSDTLEYEGTVEDYDHGL
ncbi:Hypothetical predicted protein [Paramuricea clavata]|uniref:Uncharacterized protein n=1 Tax=Paramuricea clavata TaxID=317549 RepID=A0A6S7IJK1_PARCT|nr:Hypothetical predicted protein [Paramuricea clavata]